MLGRWTLYIIIQMTAVMSEAVRKLTARLLKQIKKQAVLHYSGVGVDKNGKITEVDDYWMVNMNDLWNGRYTDVSKIQFDY